MPRELVIEKIEGKPGQVYYPLKVKEVPIPKPGPGQVLVQFKAAALNHRDLFIRQHLYPGLAFDTALLGDGYGTVVEEGPGCKRGLAGANVVALPMRGWEDDPQGPPPGSNFHVSGGTVHSDSGCARDYAVFSENEVERAPAHLDAVGGAALPLAGITGWRALVTKSGAAEAGKNILITGIGGGVALQVLQFAVALGVNAYVSSGSDEKIARALKLGAKGGINYKKDGWEKELKAALPAERRYLDAIIDGAGGPIVQKATRLLRTGGVVSQYGMTVGPKMDWIMPAVLANIELKGSTMGSHKEFRDMLAFVDKHKISPVISKSIKGLDNMAGLEELFADMRDGKNFGKLVVEIDAPRAASPSKL
ncbi:NAD(P)-binding protein [Cutaneotrichosporon oleaginosum]|uniref:NAD(P)-binding protein n=2 Tax=Cutaneotrichosporon oleaginosum TaxID=879819 RepID=A0A0J1B9V0_9TREE|nr:NAD(P)-binding protein [Cutaneotrichosporon oleaginosum]KLT44639.1 NAD(P)-binding protein [Cutaneotrichosporon oleaginosum]